MNRRKITEIVKFSVEKNIQNKAFVIFNIILCLIVVISTNLNNVKKILEDNNINLFSESFDIKIIDETGFASGRFEDIYKDYEDVNIEYIEENNYTESNITDEVVILEFKVDSEEQLNVIITSREAIDSDLYDNIISVSKDIRSELFARKLGINVKELNILNEDITIEEKMLGIDAENSEMKEIIKNSSVVIVYFVLIFVLARIANEIATEKTSKSIEYVLTSVEAKDYLLAKVLGITITIIIQVLYSFIYYMIGNSINILLNISEISPSNVSMSIDSVDTSLIYYILVVVGYLIFTVFFMCMIQAALSSKTTSVAEASNTTSLLIMLTIILYFISLACIGPYIKVTPFMYVISCIPIVSTFFVPAMMIIGQATTLQIIVSYLLLIFSTPILFNICSRTFKNGVLDYSGKKQNKRKVKKEKTIKEEQEYLMSASNMKKFGFVIGIALILWLVLQLLGSIVISTITQKLFNNILSEKSIIWIYFMIVSAISLIIPIKVVESYTESEYKKSNKTNLKSSLKIICIGFGIVFFINIIETNILRYLGLDYEIFSKEMLVTAKDSFLDKILFFIGIAVIPGIFEELFMRKAIINYGKQFGNYFALIISSLLFGLIHLNLQQGIFAFCIGLVLGIIVLKTNNVKLTMVIHILNNSMAVLSSIFDNNIILVLMFCIIAITGLVLGLIWIIKNKGLKIDKQKFKDEYKLIFKNYTFDIAIILFILLTILSENYLRVI